MSYDMTLDPDVIRAKVERRFREMLAQGYSEDDIRAEMPNIQAQINAKLEERRRGGGPRLPPPEVAAQAEAEARPGPGLATRAASFLQGATDKLSFGLYPKLTDALGLSSPEMRQQVYDDAPNEGYIGQGTGYGLSAVAGPAALTGQAVSRTTAAVAPGLASQAIGRVGAAATTGAALGMAETGDLDAAAAGAFFGTAAQAVPEAASAGRRAIQGASEWVKRYAHAQDAGLLPAARALPRGREGITRASEQARDRILARDADLTEQARADYQARVEPELANPASPAPVRRRLLEQGVANRTSSGEPLNASVPRAVERTMRQMGGEPTVDDLLRIRRTIDQEAGFGAPAPTPRQAAARDIRGAVREGIREASPAVAAADDEFAAFRRLQNRRRDILTGSEDGPRVADAPVDDAANAAPLRPADAKRAAAQLERLGDDSVEAMRGAPYLDELAAQDPAFRAALDELMAKKALEATRLLTLQPQVRTNLAQAVTNLPVIGTTANLAMQYGRGSGWLLDQALRAPEALGTRVAVDASRGSAGPTLTMNVPGLSPIAAARAKERDRDADRARKVRTRGR